MKSVLKALGRKITGCKEKRTPTVVEGAGASGRCYNSAPLWAS